MARLRVGSLLLVLLAWAPACGERSGLDHAPRKPEWIFPEAGIAWNQPEILAVAEFDGDRDDGDLAVLLDGRDLSERFLPSWPAAYGPVPEEDEEAPGRTATSEPTGSRRRRVLAVLGSSDLGEGEHHLVLRVGGSATERRFTMRRRGRVVRFRVRVAADGREGPGSARVSVVPCAGSPPIDLLPFPVLRHPATRAAVRSVALVRDGEAEVWLPDGCYEAIASRGPLDSLERWSLPQRGDAEHVFHLRREVEARGARAGDFHVHAAASRDSMVPPAERVWAAIAGGLDFIVGSDHDIVADYEPILRRLPAARDRLRVLRGTEATQGGPDGSRGHWNFWPLAASTAFPPPEETGASDPDVAAATRRFLAAWKARLPRDAAGVVQLNHPRGMHLQPRSQPIRRVHDWFNRVGFDPGQPRALPADLLEFDLLEVWNRSSRALLREVRRDWFALLNAGIVRAASANSDSHTVVPGIAGFPQNLVLAGGTRHPDGPEAEIGAALRAGRLIGTDGPVPWLTVRTSTATAGPGDRLTPRGASVRVEVEVEAAAWIPVGPIRVWSNGDVLHEAWPDRWPAQVSFEVPVRGDRWILAEAGDLERGEDGVPIPGLYGIVAPRGLAFGFTNPVLIDADGDGAFNPDVLE